MVAGGRAAARLPHARPPGPDGADRAGRTARRCQPPRARSRASSRRSARPGASLRDPRPTRVDRASASRATGRARLADAPDECTTRPWRLALRGGLGGRTGPWARDVHPLAARLDRRTGLARPLDPETLGGDPGDRSGEPERGPPCPRVGDAAGRPLAATRTARRRRSEADGPAAASIVSQLADPQWQGRWIGPDGERRRRRSCPSSQSRRARLAGGRRPRAGALDLAAGVRRPRRSGRAARLGCVVPGLVRARGHSPARSSSVEGGLNA